MRCLQAESASGSARRGARPPAGAAFPSGQLRRRGPCVGVTRLEPHVWQTQSGHQPGFVAADSSLGLSHVRLQRRVAGLMEQAGAEDASGWG
eukprot:4996274-Prymnesium_polylepis.1